MKKYLDYLLHTNLREEFNQYIINNEMKYNSSSDTYKSSISITGLFGNSRLSYVLLSNDTDELVDICNFGLFNSHEEYYSEFNLFLQEKRDETINKILNG